MSIRSAVNRRAAASAAGLMALPLLAALVLTGGCAPTEPLNLVPDTGHFKSDVLGAKQPVLLFFYKEGCAACMALDPTLEQLAAEYHGKGILFDKFALMSMVFIPYSQELVDRYDVVWYPTVILFVNGIERHRWAGDYSIDHYREVLNTLAKSPPAKP